MKRKKLLEGIPLNEYFDETRKQYLGLVLFVHGHTRNKDLDEADEFLTKFAQLGYFIVSIDAYKHGERLEEPYISGDWLEKTIDMPNVMEHTIQDLIFLYNRYYQSISNNVISSGFSMGGHIAFLMPKFLPNVKTIVPFIGTPDLIRHYSITKKDFLAENLRLCLPKLLEMQVTDLSIYKGKNLYIFNGELDHVVEAHFVKEFVKEINKQEPGILIMNTYPCGHSVTTPMMEDFFDLFEEETKKTF